MGNTLNIIIDKIVAEGEKQGLDQAGIATRAGLAPNRISKIKNTGDARFSTIEKLANAVGFKLELAPNKLELQKVINRNLFKEYD